jgi:hypothetical protein
LHCQWWLRVNDFLNYTSSVCSRQFESSFRSCERRSMTEMLKALQSILVYKVIRHAHKNDVIWACSIIQRNIYLDIWLQIMQKTILNNLIFSTYLILKKSSFENIDKES